MSADFQYCIVGGGVIGLALAYRLSRSHQDVLLIERQPSFGSETSSRNSEVIHAGFYYPTGSLKEQLCIRGKHLLYDFCQHFEVPHNPIGKLIVAQQGGESKLMQLSNKAEQLGIPLQRLNQQQLLQKEPAVHGQHALFSPTTGIIDSHAYMQALASQAVHQGATLVKQTELTSAVFRSSEKPAGQWQIELMTSDGSSQISSRYLLNTAGLAAQQVARQCGAANQQVPRLHPCRGHYFSYQGGSPFNHLVYPLPEENLTGLGIHATLDMGKQLRFGPDTEYLTQGAPLEYPVDPLLTDKFSQAIEHYFPALDRTRLQPAYSGIRPKLHAQHETAADFIFHHNRQQHRLDLFGIESPGLTASLAIAEYAEQLLHRRG